MTIALVPGFGPTSDGARPSHQRNELEEALRLANQLCAHLSTPNDGEHARGVRMRLARAHALSVVDLLNDIASACARHG